MKKLNFARITKTHSRYLPTENHQPNQRHPKVDVIKRRIRMSQWKLIVIRYKNQLLCDDDETRKKLI